MRREDPGVLQCSTRAKNRETVQLRKEEKEFSFIKRDELHKTCCQICPSKVLKRQQPMAIADCCG
ncbi:hypothetical protein NECAME_16571 [Necator americanus]|uniref:Uncharacterized protein n=1 Tax=Necator americanus TaxID=51031 RepID=W2TY33_NECAM|nr:hypothetical protein NECAME_16571 [Necator americanus]ETN85932.1 hypothetical protein NECAME_16571 [Necator americanus]